MLNDTGIALVESTDKRTVTPLGAMRYSLAALFGGLAVVAAVHRWAGVPLATAFLVYLACAYLVVALSWAALESRTYRIAMGFHHAFIYAFLALVVVLVLMQEGFRPLPDWALTVVLCVSGACYSVAGVCGFRNFIKWGRGGYRRVAPTPTDAPTC